MNLLRVPGHTIEHNTINLFRLGDRKQGPELIDRGLTGGHKSQPSMSVPLTEQLQKVSGFAPLFGPGGQFGATRAPIIHVRCNFILGATANSTIKNPITKQKIRLDVGRGGEDPQVRARVEVGRLFGEDRTSLLDEEGGGRRGPPGAANFGATERRRTIDKGQRAKSPVRRSGIRSQELPYRRLKAGHSFQLVTIERRTSPRPSRAAARRGSGHLRQDDDGEIDQKPDPSVGNHSAAAAIKRRSGANTPAVRRGHRKEAAGRGSGGASRSNMKSGGKVSSKVVGARPQGANQSEHPPQTSGCRTAAAAATAPGLTLLAYTRDPARSGGSMPATPTPKTLKNICYGASAPACSAPALALPFGTPLGPLGAPLGCGSPPPAATTPPGGPAGAALR